MVTWSKEFSRSGSGTGTHRSHGDALHQLLRGQPIAGSHDVIFKRRRLPRYGVFILPNSHVTVVGGWSVVVPMPVLAHSPSTVNVQPSVPLVALPLI
ncbi:hypothetical protein K239x_32680 [Planctomycetes bacterium K23_9]|uniref:Uncharacterized protein n=1 Tax=Stieleria marina TaxID=1930275 RepID=A0A517NVX9_9BACT|nr:hypothetical protein K239x_32680 [Planctomycetes bacterium K23_9]